MNVSKKNYNFSVPKLNACLPDRQVDCGSKTD
jgi:hypothetical protein